MPQRRQLTPEDIDAIKRIHNNTPMAEIADKYKIGYHRIYKIWNMDVNAIPIGRMLDLEADEEIDRANKHYEETGDIIIEDRDALKYKNAVLSEKIKILEWQLRDMPVKYNFNKVKALQRKLTDQQQKLQEHVETNNKLRSELNKIKNEKNHLTQQCKMLLDRYSSLTNDMKSLQEYYTRNKAKKQERRKRRQKQRH